MLPSHLRMLLPLPGASLPLSKLSRSYRALIPVFFQLHMGKQAEEQQKFGERVSGAVSAHCVCSSLWSWCCHGGWVSRATAPCPARAWVLWGSSARCPCAPGPGRCLRADPAPALPQVIYFQSALDKLNEAIKLAKASSCPGAGGCQAAPGAALGAVAEAGLLQGRSDSDPRSHSHRASLKPCRKL